jgi:3-hydroxyisobutyrate dehydrogenase-like beta-hydroxyacid dehydrogenase
MEKITLGFLGLGSIGFPMCHALAKSGYSMILPAYRKEEDAQSGYSLMVPDYQNKLNAINALISNGAKAAASLSELAAQSDIILISMPTSKQVEELVLSPEGILYNARPGTVVIDLTSADPGSTKKLSALLAEKGVGMLDAPVSGGISGAIAQTLSIMVGGREDVFEKCRPILNVIGKEEKILYIGSSGAGNTLKLVNNYLSACTTVATTEAMMVAVKAGIDPKRAIEVLKDSGGRNDATMNKYPNLIFPGKSFNFTLNLMCKDLNLFNQLAREMQIPTFISNTVYQLWNIPVVERGGNEDCLNIIRMFEDWCGVKVCGIDAE